MEPIVVIVGFLGAGKTTLLKRLMQTSTDAGYSPFVVLNDYENAKVDAEQLVPMIKPEWIKALNGSCICCSGIAELRESVNRIPERKNGITLIEANGTSDACALMGFLGVGLDDRYLPPIQLSVVDAKNWQQRGEHNALEANQIQVSSLIVLNHVEGISKARSQAVTLDIAQLNPSATILDANELALEQLFIAKPSTNQAQAFEHQKAHWASCSIDLPTLPSLSSINTIFNHLPESLLRIKGFAKIGNDEHHTYFERTPDGTLFSRPYNGIPSMGAKLLTIGPGSDKATIQKIVATYL